MTSEILYVRAYELANDSAHRPKPFTKPWHVLFLQDKKMDKSTSMMQSTVNKINSMMQGEGGVRHMLLLIVFAFIMVLILWWSVRG